jgi:hypothetical protein
MRLHLVIFFFTLSFKGISQQNSSRSILIINNASFRDCPNKAMRIESKFTFIDKCYNTKTNTLSIDKKASTLKTELYTKLYKFTFANWKQIEDKLNSVPNCDKVTPLIIIIKQGELIKKYTLARISNCYPESIKEIMESLEKEFND